MSLFTSNLLAIFRIHHTATADIRIRVNRIEGLTLIMFLQGHVFENGYLEGSDSQMSKFSV